MRTRWHIGALLTVMVLAACAEPATHGQPGAPAQDQGTVTNMPGQSADEVRAYWTPDRMRDAKPLPPPKMDPNGFPEPRDAEGPETSEVATDRSEQGPYLTLVGYAQSEGAWHGGATEYPAKYVGRLYAADPDGVDWYCTASVVRSRSHDMLLTAGGCIYQPPNSDGRRVGWFSNYKFVPGNVPGDPPFGVWTARGAGTSLRWLERADYHYNYGFLFLDVNAAGQHITDVVGKGLFVMWNVNFKNPRPYTVLSYPAALGIPPLHSPQSLMWCKEKATFDPAYRVPSMNCPTAYRSVGGPWFTNLDLAQETAAISSVTGGIHPDNDGIIVGPRFGTTFHDDYLRMSPV
jgi:hypothetical protein